ncbi:cytochrome p450 [Halogeometricum pallidum JCM 14848]|uniref:Cytochrome p450 n=1 Tax=Halogeometricum pallidum JCM 14848 TaxID=1227487 RepID=M0D7N6_HALPD|nr:cytochrome P450 [Halogeometricum pallidum]ELZ30853.1 cytochrome p450 [Halogeometricum pallidum JCM 14848]
MSIRPPGPNGVPLFGSGRQYAKDPFTFLTQVSETYGDVVRFGLGPLDTYMLTNPADIERVLVSDDARYRKPDFQDDAIGTLLGDGLLLSEGETWRKQRQLAQPAFGPGRISSLGETMTDHAESMVDGWADGEVRDVQLEMARVTVKIIVDAMFGSSLGDERVKMVQENLEPLGKRFEPDPMRFLVPDWAPTRENREYAESVAVLEGIIDDVVSARRGTENDPSAAVTRDEGGDGDGGPPMDLLSVLLRAQGRGEQTDRQIRDEMMTMLLAGHDTTALTLTYTWYLLSQHPDAETKVQEEVDAVCGGETPTAADVRQFDYVERVIQEAMRLYPPVYVIFREPQVDVRLGGYRIPEGSAVMLPQWVVHRSPRWYDRPEEFDPDRWLPARRAERPRFSYFPFGGGPRHCIGKRFSMMEAQLILATVTQAYELDYVRDEPFDLRGSLTMHPEEPMGMQLKRREES